MSSPSESCRQLVKTGDDTSVLRRFRMRCSLSPMAEPARTENVLMAWPGRMVGGTLTLTGGKLEWKRSPWALLIALPLVGPILALIMNKGPKRLSLDVQQSAVAAAGRQIPWPFMAFMALTWWGIGLLVSVPIALLSGWSRPCIAVHTSSDGETYYFAVRDPDGWLADARRAGAREAILDR